MLSCICGGACGVIVAGVVFIGSATAVAIDCVRAEKREDLE